ncbi:MAG: sigma-54-dependent Fis family transcriptional regulator, partial [Desulfofustis sp.]|nr:sigma-54-dependent Fis family transcriptional regulator [Desulfofustis sp.]
MASILIIDDDTVLCSMLFEQLTAAGHHAVQAHTLADGRSYAAEHGFDVVLLDVQLPDGNGLEHISAFKRTRPEPEVIIITGQGEADGAERAVRSGAWSYIAKPHVIRELDLHLARALQYRRERQKVTKVPVSLKRSRIIGSSSAVSHCLDQVAAAAASDVSVLISGDSGTGKELFAKAIHENSRRSQENFIIVDCAALPETLIESTLFGHVKGAFTNADRDHDGLVKHAHRGTLFLDEVGELPPAIQKTFLRLLQEHEYRPVGSTRQHFSDFRLVAATNRNLDELVAAGTFREDLLFRLKAFTIELPPLKARKEDLRELVSYFMHDICQRYSLEIKGISADFLDTLAAHDWPGNIRELSQVMEQVFTNPLLGPTCFSIHLPEPFRIMQVRAGFQQERPTGVISETCLPLWRSFKDHSEIDYLQRLRAASTGNIAEA